MPVAELDIVPHPHALLHKCSPTPMQIIDLVCAKVAAGSELVAKYLAGYH